MRIVQCLAATAALLLPAPAFAAGQPSAPPGEIRLSDVEKERVLEAAAARNRQPDVGAFADQLGEDPLPPQIHGEVGFSIGTGGYRSAYGTANIALPDDGFASIALESTDFGSRPRYIDPWWR